MCRRHVPCVWRWALLQLGLCESFCHTAREQRAPSTQSRRKHTLPLRIMGTDSARTFANPRKKQSVSSDHLPPTSAVSTTRRVILRQRVRVGPLLPSPSELVCCGLQPSRSRITSTQRLSNAWNSARSRSRMNTLVEPRPPASLHTCAVAQRRSPHPKPSHRSKARDGGCRMGNCAR